MAKVGHEFGATRRPRRCGWMIYSLKYAIQINGVTQLMMMKGDVLSGFDSIKACTAYTTSEGTQEHLPYDFLILNSSCLYDDSRLGRRPDRP